MTGPTVQAISPFFIVTDVAQTIAFYRDHLGFEMTFQEPATDPFVAILGRDGVQIFLKSESGIVPTPNHTRHPHLRWDAFVHVADPDALAADFIGRGATFSAPLAATHDGLRSFEIRDPDGYTLFFGRPQPDLKSAVTIN